MSWPSTPAPRESVPAPLLTQALASYLAAPSSAFPSSPPFPSAPMPRFDASSLGALNWARPAFNLVDGPPAASAWGAGADLPDGAAGAAADAVGQGVMHSLGRYLKDIGFVGGVDPKTGLKNDGWGGLAFDGLKSLGGLYLGMQQYNLAKASLAAGQSQFERNFAAQRDTLNTALEDRQRARVASNPGAYESVDAYLRKHEVK